MRLEVEQPILDRREHGEAPPHRAFSGGAFNCWRARHLLSGGVGQRTAWKLRSPASPRRPRTRSARATHHPDPLRSRGLERTWPIPALLATAAVHEHLVRKGLRTSTGLVVETGSRARGASLRAARRLRRRSGPSVSRARDARIRRAIGPCVDKRSAEALPQGDRQGPVQGDVEDGHLDLQVAAARRSSRRSGSRRRSWTSTSPARRATSRASASSRSPRRRDAPLAFGERSGARRHARRRRRVRVPRAGRRAHVDARRDRQAAARDAREQVCDLQGVRAAHQRPEAQAQ